MGNRLVYATGTDVRAAILYSNSMMDKILMLNQLCNKDMATVIMKVKQKGGNLKNILLCSLYIPCGDIINLDNLRLVTGYAKSSNLDLLICTDSNSHHKLWFDNKIDVRGEELADFLSENRLTIHNGETKTFFRANCATAIDLTLSLGNIGCSVMNWKCENLMMGSDHMPITFELHSITKKKSVFRNPKKTDWTKFENNMKLNLPQLAVPIYNSFDAEKTMNKLVNVMSEGFNSSCDKTYVRFKTEKKWRTSELEKLKHRVRGLWDDYFEETDPDEKEKLRVIYNKERNEYNRVNTKAKRESFEKYDAQVKSLPECARITNIQKNLTNCNLNTLRRFDNSFTKDAGDTMKLMLDECFPNNIEANISQQPVQLLSSDCNNELLNKRRT